MQRQRGLGEGCQQQEQDLTGGVRLTHKEVVGLLFVLAITLSGSNWRCVQVFQWMYDEWFFLTTLTPDLSLLRKAAGLVYVFLKLQLSACRLHVL